MAIDTGESPAIFPSPGEIGELEERLQRGDAEHRAHRLARLSWYLRQSETARALALADECAALACASPSLAGRLALVRADAARLGVRRDEALAQIGHAEDRFGSISNAVGLGDAAFARAMIANDRGEAAERDLQLDRALARYREAGDAARVRYVEARRAIDDAYRNPGAAEEKWASPLAASERAGESCTRARIEEFRAWLAFSRGEFARAAPLYLAAHEHALESAQWPMAVMELTNAGAALAELNDHSAALELLERGLALARRGGWPGSVGICLVQAGLCSRELGRHDAAASFLDEAMRVLEPLEGSRLHAIALQYQGDLALARGEARAALAWYERFEARGRALASPDLVAHALLGRAQALSGCGRKEEAAVATRAALEVAREMGDGVRQVAALRELAAQCALSDVDSRERARAYLEQAVEVARGVEGYLAPAQLFSTLASIHAAGRDFETAYRLALEAAAAESGTQVKKATDRMLALQVRHSTEKAMLEAQQQRRIAAAEAERAAALEEAYRQLERAQRMLEEASITDALTGLRNRRFLLDHIERDVAMCLRRHDEPGTGADRDLVFFLVDLDHFKKVNDTYGHAAGDAVLREMRNRLARVFRDSDHVVRWGGEEFLAVARDADRRAAPELAERLRLAVASEPFPLGDGRSLARTCSIGVAAFPLLPRAPRDCDWAQVVEAADLALYAAKRSGRNAWAMLEAGPGASSGADLLRQMRDDLPGAIRTGSAVLRCSHEPAAVFAATEAGATERA